ncbi:TrmB family transcriptional regulator [Paenibacillus sp. NPDC057934]|uniref:TrmB family transcriptional regulator n=1 Tax=Paenibacillus sp. NPDC057934 TaxID=3346282 RepID=UPI0036D75C70
MIEELRKIGLSDLEARCYLTLHEEGNLSGYEVAKRVSVSRTNVYAALRSLTDKGVCRAIEAEPVLYDAVPIGQLIRLLKADFEQTAANLLEQMQNPVRTTTSFYNWQGERALEMAIRRLVANADKSIIVDLWSEDIHWVEEVLLEAENRGVEVVLITIGESHTPLKKVIVHERQEAWNGAESRRFSILCDNRSALIGSFGKTLRLTALESDHPSVIELLQNAFYHDVVMERIGQDFAEVLAAKYGSHYEAIIAPYKGLLE